MSTGTPDRDSRAAAPPGAALKGRLFGLDHRFLAPILITAILLVGEVTYGILDQKGYWTTGLAIVSAIFLELALGRLVTGRWPHLASAYISGISVGILVRSPELWPYIVCSLLSISSKYAIRVKGRHLWNPSNLGVSVLLLLAPETVSGLGQQWGNEIWPLLIIWCLGCLILYRLGLLHITLTYVAAFLVLSFVRSVYSNVSWLAEIVPLTFPIYQLFIFFMITDPKTITRTKARQCAVAVLVAVVDTVLRLNAAALSHVVAINAPLYALFIVGPAANLLEIWWDSRHARKVCAVPELPAVAAERNPTDPSAPVAAAPSTP